MWNIELANFSLKFKVGDRKRINFKGFYIGKIESTFVQMCVFMCLDQ